MKRKQMFYGIAMSLLFLMSCEKDDNESKTIVGEWYISSQTISGCTEGGNAQFDFMCTEDNCLKIALGSGSSYDYYSLINGKLTQDHGTYLIMEDYIEVCRQNGTVCNNYELTFTPGSDVFTTKDTDGATGCVTLTTYIRL